MGATATAVLALLLSLCVHTVCSRRVNGVGYDIEFPPNRDVPQPHLPTPTNTRAVADRYPREAQLVCVEQAPVNRVVLCDILTWDNCGNVYGRSGNETRWSVEVRHATTGRPVRLLSPVIHLEEGVFRFYFTPTAIGVYAVRVQQANQLALRPLLTPKTMKQLIVVHDSVSRCTSVPIGTIHPQLRQLLWAQVSNTNELQPIVGVDGISKRTNVVVDFAGVYRPSDAVLQQRIRRTPLTPMALEPLGDIPREDDNNFNLCDVLQQT